MKRDILHELGQGAILPDEAERIFEAVLDAGKMGLGEGVGLSNIEYTAYGHGVGLAELEKWRHHGWPNKCVLCGKSIDIPKFGWMAKELKSGRHSLEHIKCPFS